MKGGDILKTVIIIVLFGVVYAINLTTIGLKNIEKNWALYRCNPTIMPFASYFGHDPMENFTYCVQNMQMNYMSHILRPIHFNIDIIGNITNTISEDINMVRKKFGDLGGTITSAVSSIMGIFLNMMIEIQTIFIKLKDTFAKMIGILLTSIYIMETGIKSGESVMAGPIGKTLRFVCFHPYTPILVENSHFDIEETIMKDVKIGDKIPFACKNHEFATVEGVVKVKGNVEDKNNRMYALWSKKIDDAIYVTEHHKILDPNTKEWVKIRDATFVDTYNTNLEEEELICLITDTGTIPVGEHIFADWEME
jgi:hypothetical protein